MRLDQMKLVILIMFIVLFLHSQNLYSLDFRSKSKLIKQGNLNYQNKKYQSAINDYKLAAVKDPDDYIIRYNIATTSYALGEFKKAKDIYNKLIDAYRDPETKSRMFYNYGNSLYRLGDYDQSIEYYKKSLDYNPEDEDAKYNLEFLQKRRASFQMKNQQRKERREENDTNTLNKERKKNEKQNIDNRSRKDSKERNANHEKKQNNSSSSSNESKKNNGDKEVDYDVPNNNGNLNDDQAINHRQRSSNKNIDKNQIYEKSKNHKSEQSLRLLSDNNNKIENKNFIIDNNLSPSSNKQEYDRILNALDESEKDLLKGRVFTKKIREKYNDKDW